MHTIKASLFHTVFTFPLYSFSFALVFIFFCPCNHFRAQQAKGLGQSAFVRLVPRGHRFLGGKHLPRGWRSHVSTGPIPNGTQHCSDPGQNPSEVL